MGEGLHYLSIAEAGARIASHKLSPVALVEACLARIAALDGQFASFVTVLGERALAEARRAEIEIRAGRWRGPLHGIPVGLKDVYDLEGVATTCHSRLRLGRVAGQDAAPVRRLRDAGAIVLGKHATHEFAFGGPSFDLPFPPARNPWDTARFTGGSSSGSAAAVAAGLCFGALATDAIGSIRIPGALCGVAGLKPTRGRVPCSGVVPLAPSLDHCGPLARTAGDCALLLAALTGDVPPAPLDGPPRSKPLANLRVGVVRHFHENDARASDAQCEAVEAAVRRLSRLGASVREARLPPLDLYHACGLAILLAEAYAAHERDLVRRPRAYGRSFRLRAMLGAFVGGAEYAAAMRLRRRLAAEMTSALEDRAVLITATTAGAAPRLEYARVLQLVETPLLTTPASVTGHPALTVCCGFDGEGLPLGLQLMGRPGDEATLFTIATAFESGAPWRRNRPVP